MAVTPSFSTFDTNSFFVDQNGNKISINTNNFPEGGGGGGNTNAVHYTFYNTNLPAGMLVTNGLFVGVGTNQSGGGGSITLTGDIAGTGTGTIATTLKNTGTSGTYRSVTFDAQGRETGGSNPTTFSGYGISDSWVNLAAVLSGTVPISALPVATTGALGLVEPDGVTIGISAGVISVIGGGSDPTRVATNNGISFGQTIIKPIVIGSFTNSLGNGVTNVVIASTTGDRFTNAVLTANGMKLVSVTYTNGDAEALNNFNIANAFSSDEDRFSSDGIGNVTVGTIDAMFFFLSDEGSIVSDGSGNLLAVSYSGSGAALTALNASQLASGTVPAARLPLATSSAFGAVKVDGATITAAAGVISAALQTAQTNGLAGLSAFVATNKFLGTNLLLTLTSSGLDSFSVDGTGKGTLTLNTNALQYTNNNNSAGFIVGAGIGTNITATVTNLSPIIFTNVNTLINFFAYNGTTTNTLIQATNALLIIPNLQVGQIASTESNSLAPASISFPATTVNWTNTFGMNIELYVNNPAVTGTAFKKNGTTIFTSVVGDITIHLQPNEYFSETYTVGTPAATWSPF